MLKTDKPRGVLTHGNQAEKVWHARYHAPADLDFFVEHFWTVRWNLAGLPPQQVQTLPHPSVHLIFEPGNTKLGGVSKGKFSRMIEGDSFVYAIKFRPAGFYPFYGKPLSTLTNRVVDPVTIFGKDFLETEQRLLNAGSVEAMQAVAEEFLRGRLPAKDETMAFLNELLQKIIADRSITRVEQLPEITGRNIRNLQRLFSTYIGVSPKWVIRRYRIHDALERVKDGGRHHWAALALDLGYADQAHFIRDFKALVGKTPVAYQETVSAS